MTRKHTGKKYPPKDYEPLGELPPEWIDEASQYIREGKPDTRDGKRLIEEHKYFLENGIEPLPELTNHIVHAYQRYLDDADLDVAFGVARPKIGNPGADRDEQLKLAIAVEELVWVGEKPWPASATVAAKKPASQRKTYDAWKEWKEKARLSVMRELLLARLDARMSDLIPSEESKR